MGRQQNDQAKLFYEFCLRIGSRAIICCAKLIGLLNRFVDLSELRAHLTSFYSYRGRPSWILARSATGSREADLGVFAKLFEDRLEGRLEAETFSRREIGGYDDVLDFLIGQAIDVDVTRQPAPQAAIGVFDSALLPRGISIAEPGGHGAHALQQTVLGESRVIIESD